MKRHARSGPVLLPFFFILVQLNRSVLGDYAGKLEPSTKELSVVKGQTNTVEFIYGGAPLQKDLFVQLNTSGVYISLDTERIHFYRNSSSTAATVVVHGLSITSLTSIDVTACYSPNGTETNEIACPFNKEDAFVQVKVVHSNAISVLVIITGWIYFIAWSISFYPQIVLNFQRKSVVGLNFDFLLLNIIGFSCYTIYNLMLYFDSHVQDIYIKLHPRSLIPVLLNDVVFASHALFACIVTAFQCFIYERGNQKISYICYAWSSLLIVFSLVSLAVTAFEAIDWLQFITFLAYIKMAVTLSKYFPQAILNFRRKSTIGWSIGNVLLDFSGGFMDICQMVLQASNTNDWSAFYGNPVKFGLGLISMVFDVMFIIQHYFLYSSTNIQTTLYDQVETNDAASSTTETRVSPPPPSYPARTQSTTPPSQSSPPLPPPTLQQIL